ncbi:hypothetical protein [Cupriavidus basilensis]|nr:hypothetical protein [Cupriavidus basilensis]
MNRFLRAYLHTYCAPSFYTIENEHPYKLTAADFASRRSSEVQS